MVKKVFSFALHQEVIYLIDEYRRHCDKIPSRSEAVEQMIIIVTKNGAEKR